MDKQQLKEEKWGAYKKKLVAELESLTGEGWTIVYTDGSAKVVRGWAQAGYGAWYGHDSLRNSSDFVPLGEKQSVSRAELRGVLHAVRSRRWEERMIVVLDSEYVFKGITQWSRKWQRHQWRVLGKEGEHKELWMSVLADRELAGDRLQVRWVPSHLGWRAMRKQTRWQSRGDCGIRIMRTPCLNDAAWSSNGSSWGSRKCLPGRGRPAHSTGSLSGEADAPEAGPAASLDSLGWGDSDDYSTDVSDNPRKRGRRVAQGALH